MSVARLSHGASGDSELAFELGRHVGEVPGLDLGVKRLSQDRVDRGAERLVVDATKEVLIDGLDSSQVLFFAPERGGPGEHTHTRWRSTTKRSRRHLLRNSLPKVLAKRKGSEESGDETLDRGRNQVRQEHGGRRWLWMGHSSKADLGLYRPGSVPNIYVAQFTLRRHGVRSSLPDPKPYPNKVLTTEYGAEVPVSRGAPMLAPVDPERPKRTGQPDPGDP